MAQSQSLHAAFIDQLCDAYDADRAHTLGRDDAAQRLQDSPEEEEAADKKFTDPADEAAGDGDDDGTANDAPVGTDEVVEAETNPDGGTLGGRSASGPVWPSIGA